MHRYYTFVCASQFYYFNVELYEKPFVYRVCLDAKEPNGFDTKLPLFFMCNGVKAVISTEVWQTNRLEWQWLWCKLSIRWPGIWWCSRWKALSHQLSFSQIHFSDTGRTDVWRKTVQELFRLFFWGAGKASVLYHHLKFTLWFKNVFLF